MELVQVGGDGKLDDAEDDAHCKGDHGRAEEGAQVGAEAAPLGHRGDGAQSHEHDGHHNGSKRDETAGKLAVLGLDLLVGGNVAACVGLVLSLDALADEAGEHDAGDQGKDGADNAQAHDEQQVVLKAERTGGGDGAGRRRDEDVADIQAARQAHGEHDRACGGLLHDGLADGVQNDEARVAKHRDGDDPAHELHGNLRMLLAHEGHHHVGELERAARGLEDGAHQGAQDNDDADAGEGTRETRTDDGGDARNGCAVFKRSVDQRDAGHQTKHQGHEHDGNERVNLELGDHHDHRRNCDDEGDDQRYSGHGNLLPKTGTSARDLGQPHTSARIVCAAHGEGFLSTLLFGDYSHTATHRR